MNTPHNNSKQISDPFDLIDTGANIVPLLSKDKLATMIDKAVTHEQIAAPKQQAPKISIAKTGWWSGGLATAACLILLLTLSPMKQASAPISGLPVSTANQTQPQGNEHQNIASDTTSDDDITISDLMLMETFDSF